MMPLRHAVISIALIAPALAQDESLPLNPAVNQANIQQTICVSGWSRSVRPPYSVTNRIKVEKLAALGMTEGDKSRFELDHTIPIAIGGALADERNLALQRWGEASEKDMVEACLRTAVCSGHMSLEAAQRAVWNDWRKAGEACNW